MGALGFAGDDIVEGHVDGPWAGQQLDERLRDRVDRVPVDRQADVDVVRTDRRVAG